MQPFARLSEDLKIAGIAMANIRINETPQDGCFCLLNYGDVVECFYSERGAKFELETFTSQENAIEYFKKWVLANETLYLGWSGTVGKL